MSWGGEKGWFDKVLESCEGKVYILVRIAIPQWAVVDRLLSLFVKCFV
jgi:hypothetical protein